MRYLLLVLIAIMPLTAFSTQFTDNQLIGSYSFVKGDTQIEVFELLLTKVLDLGYMIVQT